MFIAFHGEQGPDEARISAAEASPQRNVRLHTSLIFMHNPYIFDALIDDLEKICRQQLWPAYLRDFRLHIKQKYITGAFIEPLQPTISLITPVSPGTYAPTDFEYSPILSQTPSRPLLLPPIHAFGHQRHRSGAWVPKEARNHPVPWPIACCPCPRRHLSACPPRRILP